MADISKVAEYYPATRDFRRNDRLGFRGDVLSYWSNVEADSYSTDAQGFRHTVFGGSKYSLVECTRSPRYGVALGPSTFMGSGVAGNENTLASRLSERFGFPVANAAMPGGDSRNLHTLLIGLLATAKQPPAIIILSNGGDLARVCSAGHSDPVFGSPNHVQMKAIREFDIPLDPEAEFRKLLVFTKLWTSVTASLCKARKIPLVFVHQSTFFEKTKPSAIERACKLGEPIIQSQERLFSYFRQFNPRFFAKRRELASELGLPLGAVDSDRLEFIDEFHINADSFKLLSDAVADAAEPLLGVSKPKPAKKKASTA